MRNVGNAKTYNLLVVGSSPTRCTIEYRSLVTITDNETFSHLHFTCTFSARPRSNQLRSSVTGSFPTFTSRAWEYDSCVSVPGREVNKSSVGSSQASKSRRASDSRTSFGGVNTCCGSEIDHRFSHPHSRSNNSLDSAYSARSQIDLDGDLDAVPISL